MTTLIIPLTILMLVSLVFYTIPVFNINSKKIVRRSNIALLHPSLVLFIIGLFYMSGISSKLPYTNVSYAMMDFHQGIGFIALIILIVHVVLLTILKLKKVKFGSKLKSLNIILWILYLICFIIALYIGIKAGF